MNNSDAEVPRCEHGPQRVRANITLFSPAASSSSPCRRGRVCFRLDMISSNLASTTTSLHPRCVVEVVRLNVLDRESSYEEVMMVGCPPPGLAHMSRACRAGSYGYDGWLSCLVLPPSLPLPPPRPAAHCGAVRAPHHSARSRCPSRPATHSEASMRRTLISYYSFYTQQGGRPVQYGVPYDSWWQLRGSTQVDAVSPGLVNPPPTTHPTPQRPPPYSATNRPP